MTDRDRYNELIVEIMETERKFCLLAAEKGVREAFLTFAAKDAVINRNDRIYAGKEEIGQYFDSQTVRDVRLTWKPDYVDVSESGDMAWSYGPYSFSGTGEDGQEISAEGIFHTVWKRQSDGNWKFVWD